MKLYAGIGAREAPPWALELAEQLADRLRAGGYTLRSGHAPGMDSAFEDGAMDDAEVYLPWPSFGGSVQARTIIDKPTAEAFNVALPFHPNPAALSRGSRRLHARNAHIILGRNLHDPATFVACWYEKPGGTSLACTIAQSRGVPVFNMARDEDRKRLERWAFDFGE